MASALTATINRESGLLGVSGMSSDMRELLEHEMADAHVAEAIDLFCYLARKQLCALTAPLGGLDTLVFTGGIGEHAAAIRSRICVGLAYLGIHIDPDRNETHLSSISKRDAPVTVRVMRTEEDTMIARHTLEVLVNQPTLQTHPMH
jgi:acetate kinase